MRKIFSTLLPALILFASCSSVSYVAIDTAQPAKTNLNYYFQSPTVVVSKYPSDNEHNEILSEKMFEGDFVFSIKDQCASAFSQATQYSLFVNNQKEVNNVSLYREMENNIVPKLSDTDIDSIATAHNADCIIGLDYFKPLMLENQTSAYKTEYKALIVALWRIYDVNQKKVVKQKTVLDTVKLTVYEDAMWDLQDVKAEMLYRIDYRAYELGIEFSNTIVPYWKQESRAIYPSGHVELDRAWRFVSNNEWEKAAVIWLEFSKNKDKRLRFYSLFNLAVASEYFGSIEKANEYLDEAEKIKSNEETVKYRFILVRRQKINTTLDSQMGY